MVTTTEAEKHGNDDFMTFAVERNNSALFIRSKTCSVNLELDVVIWSAFVEVR
jgi:hypothetical protein